MLLPVSVTCSLVAQVENLPAMQETEVGFWRRKWQTTPVSLPGKSHGQRGLVGCSPWNRKDSDTTERLTLSVRFTRLYFQAETHTCCLHMLDVSLLFLCPNTLVKEVSSN